MSKRRARKIAFLKKTLDAGKYIRRVVLERYGLLDYVPTKEEAPAAPAVVEQPPPAPAVAEEPAPKLAPEPVAEAPKPELKKSVVAPKRKPAAKKAAPKKASPKKAAPKAEKSEEQ
tara:strand:- start:1375 stop:1722 length:348 start_codon:yes stop_codon:yes gene_type:complete